MHRRTTDAENDSTPSAPWIWWPVLLPLPPMALDRQSRALDLEEHLLRAADLMEQLFTPDPEWRLAGQQLEAHAAAVRNWREEWTP